MSKNLYFELNQYNSLLSFEQEGDHSIIINFNNEDIYWIDKINSSINTCYGLVSKKSNIKLLKSFFNMSDEDVDYILNNKYSSFFIDKARICFTQFNRHTKNANDFICRLDIMINKKYITIGYLKLCKKITSDYYIKLYKYDNSFEIIDGLYNNIHKHLKLKFTDYQKDLINSIILSKKFLNNN